MFPIHIKNFAGPIFNPTDTAAVTGLQIAFDGLTSIATVSQGTLSTGSVELTGRTVGAATRTSDNAQWDGSENLLDFCQDTVVSIDTAVSGCSSLTLGLRKYKFN